MRYRKLLLPLSIAALALTALPFIILATPSGDPKLAQPRTPATIVDVAPQPDEYRELRNRYDKESLGGTCKIVAHGKLVFVHTFPYSGVDASNLYVYEQHGSAFLYSSSFRIPSHLGAEFRPDQNGDIEIWANDKQIATISHPAVRVPD